MTSGDPVDSSEPPLAPGTAVGEYEIRERLGEGGFGAVYSAVHPLIGKSAAVKVLKREFSAKPEMVQRFMSEARAVNQIRHRNIIDIFSFGKLDDGRHYYVMELLEGSPLDRYLAKHGKLSVADAVPVLRQLARALGAAHAAGITHRDIKPENVFLTFDDDRQPVAKLLDFGIAKLVVDNFSQHKTRSGTPMGTPLYMSPEQVHGTAVDSRSDIYSFGIMVFQMLTGHLPFEGETMMSVLMKQINEPAPYPTSLDPSFPRQLEAPLLQMLEKDPADRPPGIVEAVEDLVAAAVRAGLTSASSSTPSGLDPAPFSPHLAAAMQIKSPSATEMEALASSDTLVASEASASTATSRSSTAAPSRAKFYAMGLALAAVAAVAVIAMTRRGPDAAEHTRTSVETAATPLMASAPFLAPSPSPPSQPAGSGSVAELPAKIKLKIKTNVTGAEVWNGTERLGAAGDELELPRAAEKIVLTVKKSGYLPQTLELTPTGNLAEAVVLQPAPSKQPEWGTF